MPYKKHFNHSNFLKPFLISKIVLFLTLSNKRNIKQKLTTEKHQKSIKNKL